MGGLTFTTEKGRSTTLFLYYNLALEKRLRETTLEEDGNSNERHTSEQKRSTATLAVIGERL